MFLAATAMTALTTSCMNDDDVYNAGFQFYRPLRAVNTLFANNTLDSISMVSFGNWTVSSSSASGGQWLSVGASTGKGNVYYTIPVTIKQNATGESRYAEVTFTDQNHPTEGHATIYYWQFATRGDGSMGNAPDVKTISGTDGSRFELAYDELHRPVSLRATKGDQLLHSLDISYSDRDSTLTVNDRGNRLTSAFAADYQPRMLVSEQGDTIGYFPQYYASGFPMATNVAFNFEHRNSMGIRSARAYLMGGQDMSPDSLHCADSLRLVSNVDGTPQLKKIKLHYSKADNRHQTVDANQLLFGIEQCDPYLLLSLFRYARQTSIVSAITTDAEADRIDATTTLNADGSLRTLTVSHQGSEIVYTFEY